MNLHRVISSSIHQMSHLPLQSEPPTWNDVQQYIDDHKHIYDHIDCSTFERFLDYASTQGSYEMELFVDALATADHEEMTDMETMPINGGRRPLEYHQPTFASTGLGGYQGW